MDGLLCDQVELQSVGGSLCIDFASRASNNGVSFHQYFLSEVPIVLSMREKYDKLGSRNVGARIVTTGPES